MSNIHSFSEVLGKDDTDKKDLIYTNGASSGTYVRALPNQDNQGNEGGAPSFFDDIRQNGVQNESAHRNGPARPGEVLSRVTIILWENGVTVKEHPPGAPETSTTSADRHEDVPLRPLDDPRTREFLEALRANELPAEFSTDRNKVYDFELVDRHTQRWEPASSQAKQQQPPPHIAFSGEGFSLAGNADSNPGVGASSAVAGREQPAVDKSKPTTRVQVRLGNGKRVVGVFNQSNVVADLYAFTEKNSCTPGKPFNLVTVAPPVRTLTEMETSLADAKLLNSVVSQKFI